MLKWNALLVCLFAFSLSCLAQTDAQKEKKERIIASYMLSFGRAPHKEELDYWMKEGNYSLADYIGQRRQYMNSMNRKEREGAVKSSYLTIMGRNPEKAELDYWMGQTHTFSEMLEQHMGYLSRTPAEWERTVRNSYATVFSRPDEGGVKYWISQKPMPFSKLVIKHLEWNRDYNKNDYFSLSMNMRNTITLGGGANSMAVTSFSMKVANEVVNLLGENFKKALGGNVIATGGGNVISTGGGNVIATGGGNVISVGGGNCISTGGANIIMMGNGNLIVQPAGVISTGGGNLGTGTVNVGSLYSLSGGSIQRVF